MDSVNIQTFFMSWNTYLSISNSHLNEDSVEVRLRNLFAKVNRGLRDESIHLLDDLRFISIWLNNGKCFQWQLFEQYDSFRVFTRIFEHCVLIMKKKYVDDDENVYRQLRDLLEIIYKRKKKCHLSSFYE